MVSFVPFDTLIQPQTEVWANRPSFRFAIGIDKCFSVSISIEILDSKSHIDPSGFISFLYILKQETLFILGNLTNNGLYP